MKYKAGQRVCVSVFGAYTFSGVIIGRYNGEDVLVLPDGCLTPVVCIGENVKTI